MVIKFNPNGKVLMLIGRRPEAGRRTRGDDRPAARRRPTRSRTRSAVPPTSAGIRRATSTSPTATPTRASSSTTRTGKFIKSVGTRGTAPGQMNTPHSLQVDAKGNMYIADRGNARIQVFDNNLVLQARSTTTSATRGRSASRRGRISTCIRRTRIPTATRPPRATSPARSTRWSSTAPSSASSARPASS